MDLELRHLRCLVAIVDTGSFTDAAIELGISQAAVSRTLLSLEAVLGVRLLHRTSRTVSPTTEGVQVLGRARRMMDPADELVSAATTASDTAARKVFIDRASSTAVERAVMAPRANRTARRASPGGRCSSR